MNSNFPGLGRSVSSFCVAAIMTMFVATGIGLVIASWLFSGDPSADLASRVLGAAIFLGLVQTVLTTIAQTIASRIWLSAGLVATFLTGWIASSTPYFHSASAGGVDWQSLLITFVGSYVYALAVGCSYSRLLTRFRG